MRRPRSLQLGILTGVMWADAAERVGTLLMISTGSKPHPVFASSSAFVAGIRREEVNFQLAFAPSAFLKAKMPPALIQASKSLRWKRRPLPTFTLGGAVFSLTYRLSVCSLTAR